MSEPGTVVTFYSYKGGTGRTMALANTGVALARQGGGPVLMIDWDLEAPGLPEFFPEVDAHRSVESPKPGVLELFEGAWERSLKQDRQLDQAFWRECDLQHCIVETSEPSLHLMRAGAPDDESYGARVNAFPWRELFERSPEVFRGFAAELASRYRYVLIDSRTGLADTSGICTTLMPDRLVVVFTPNRQSLTGVLDLVRSATAYRGRSPDLRPLLVFPLASRVEMSEDALRREWRYGNKGVRGYQPWFEQIFKEAYDLRRCDLERYFDEVQIQHATRYAYGERVAVRDERSDRLSLSRSYERFARALLEDDPPWAFEGDAPRRVLELDEEGLLRRLGPLRQRHEYIARRERLLDLSLLLVVGVSLAFAIAFAIVGVLGKEPLAEYLPISLFGVVAAGFFVRLRRDSAFRERSQIHARAASSLLRERMLYDAQAGPYRRRDAPGTVLVERIDEIEEESENLLIDPRRSLRALQPSGDEETDSR